MGRLSENRAGILRRMASACQRAGRDASSVRLIAVSKFRPLDQSTELYESGQRLFAENRVQEGRDKIPQMPSDCEWHLIGQLQTNKAKYLPGLFSWVHSVDRPEVVEALEKAFAKAGQRLNVLIEVNVAGEEQKGGVAPDGLRDLVTRVRASSHLDLRGLMTMAPYVDDPQVVRPVFRRLRELAGSIGGETGIALPELSMGMTNDFEVAVEEGATLVRIGTALYQTEEGTPNP
jgi:pyridoxal phosphate enzyme (YggS family)